ncbi:MAG: nucleotide sugar dehydrogenase [Ignavibacteria bacterium]|nr:nucleotide sugar dehydrogenase [Ignavibacteria bacterium]
MLHYSENYKINKVSVIGLGYVGLPLACAISKMTDVEIVGYDMNEEKIKKIKNRICPIDDEQCAEDLKTVNFDISFKSEIINGSDLYIVCVPTPVRHDYSPDLEPVESSSRTILKYLKKGQVVMIESTINPGVCEEIVKPILEESGMQAGVDFDIVHCPERINPGDKKWNVYNIPRNIGSTNPAITKITADFYRSFISAEINEMPDLKTTEATKIIENTFRDINIAFVNELAKSFDVLGIDLLTVIKGASNKPFAFMPHYPGCGVGGHCIPVDPYYLIERARQSGFDHKFVKLAREINNSMPAYTINLLANELNKFDKAIKNTKIGLLGLSYKANVGDIRESPSIPLRNILNEKFASLEIYDPYFLELSTCKSLEEILEKSFAIIVATNHTEFLKIDSSLLLKYDVPIVIDGRNCLDKSELTSKGIHYKGIGH